MTASHAILVVDDNSINLSIISELLDSAGFRVLVARNGETALQKAEHTAIDLILLDVMMPGIDGFETCRQLKSNTATSEIPVIFMTALTDAVDKVKGLSLGAVDYITKPLQHAEVLARIQIHLKLHHLTQTLVEQNYLLKQENIERVAAEQALQQLTQELEQRVEHRTAELSQALSNLQQVQIQLIQQEKLSALGQLMAGVAHEINNPVNFIHGNINHAKTYIEELLETLNLYQKTYPQPPTTIEQHCEAIDLDFLATDLPKLIVSMQEGTKRIREIVLSLRSFSRLNEAEMKFVNLHEGIDSTLLILQHRLKISSGHPPIKVIKNYGDLPQVECYAGQINQVFMNIVVNAIDAIEQTIASKQAVTGTITITTRINDTQHAVVCIADSGFGLTETAKTKLFDPFFTTKPVGKGTGLGLSISRQIIEEQHGGKLSCLSTPETGTQFTIEIPLKAVISKADSKLANALLIKD